MEQLHRFATRLELYARQIEGVALRIESRSKAAARSDGHSVIMRQISAIQPDAERRCADSSQNSADRRAGRVPLQPSSGPGARWSRSTTCIRRR